jgi:RNA polymerase sigma factor (sigma-70 family)
MLSLRKTEITPEELFIRSYSQLLSWSLHLTGGDRTAAEDLLHDVYILFSLHRPDISSIDNLEGYLYTMLRNLHISRLRRAARSPLKQLSVIDLDSAERVLQTLTTEDRVLVQDQLRAVCRYACARKEKAKAACALILRFFHGYYPSEVARVLRTTRQAVDVRLLRARNEVKLFLENPRALGLLEGRLSVGAAPAGFARPADDFLDELRRTVYRSRLGPCLSRLRLKELYRPGAETQPEQAQLAHVVSCPECLDEVNRLLGIPRLSERHPADSITRASRGGGGGRPGGASGGGVPPQKMKRLRRSAGEVFEHKPQELCVSVNGHVRGSHRVNSERSELSLVVETAEPISFVEIFSEQDVRLLMLPVTAPPAGAGEQAAGVGLSDGRRLDISLKFRSPWPAVQVLYYDPTYREVEELASEPLKLDEAILSGAAEAAGQTGGQGHGPRISEVIGARLKGLLSGEFWLRPGAATVALALLLITTLLVWRSQGPASVSAAELLSRSASAEEAGNPGVVTHSIIRLEERQAGGAVRSGRQIQVWRSAGTGLTVRRLYDEHGQLRAGEWRSADGSRAVYLSPQARADRPRDAGDAPWEVDDVWRLGLSARDFAALIGRDANARVEEKGDSYLLTYEGGAETAVRGLVRATLVLNRRNLRATEQSLTVRQGESERYFIFTEVLYESWPKGSTPPKVFERDAEFGDARAVSGEQPAAGATTSSKAEAHTSSAPDERATMALEVEVLKLLNQAGADLGEQVSVARTPQGSLHVQAVVDTEERKAQILSALAPVMGESALVVEVVTAVEAQRRKTQTPKPPGPTTVRQFEPGDDHVPADTELRRYLRARGGDGEQLEADVLSFSVRASTHSRNALQHAWALKRLVGRFSAQEMDSLDMASKLKWLSMMREHADAVRREAAALRRQLQPVFPPDRAVPPGGSPGAPAAEGVAGGAARLLEMCSTVDAMTGAAFTVSAGPSAPAEVRSARYWRALLGAEMLAEQLRRYAQESSRSAGAKRREGAQPSAP